MIARLVLVEVRRLLARRAVRVAAVVVLGLILVVMGKQLLDSRPLDAATRARIEEQSRRYSVPYSCFTTTSSVEIGGPGEGPPGSQVTFEDADRCEKEYRVVDKLPDDLVGIGGMVAVAAFLVGATAGGAEWTAGTMQALLFWEPRRIRVILSKVAALALVVVAFAVVAQLLGAALGFLVGSARGSTIGVDGEFWGDLLGTSARVALLPAFTALLAFGIAGFTRNTGAALGAAFVYFAILENVIRGTLPGLQRYLVMENVGGWVENGLEIGVRGRVVNGEFVHDVIRITAGSAGVVLLGYLLVVVGALTASFASRDVT